MHALPKLMGIRTARECLFPIPSLCRALDFVFFVERVPTFVVVLRCTTLLLSCLIQGRALRYAVIVAFPDNVGICGESEQSLDGFTILNGISTILLMSLDVSQRSLGVFHLTRKLAGDSWGTSLHQF